MPDAIKPFLALGVLLLSGAALAQEPAPVAPPPPVAVVAPVPVADQPPVPTPPTVSATTLFMLGDYMSAAASSPALQTRIELNAQDMPVLDAIKSVLEQAKIQYEAAPEVLSDAKVSGSKISMTLKNVPAVSALMLLTREAGVGWSYQKKDDRESVRLVLVKNPFKNRMAISMPDVRIEMPDLQHLESVIEAATADSQRIKVHAVQTARAAERAAQQGLRLALSSQPLSQTEVKLDVRNTDIRDTLKMVLEQAKVDYVLEEDIPSDIKRSFTFEKVPLSTALDVICQSAEIGWRTEWKQDPTDQPETDKKGKSETMNKAAWKPLVKVGKKYAGTKWQVAPSRFYGNASGQGGFSYSLSPGALPPGATGVGGTYTPSLRERRATFTCPHCKNKTTIVPASGSTRDSWKFCPKCGKAVGSRASDTHEDEHQEQDHQEEAFFSLPGLTPPAYTR